MAQHNVHQDSEIGFVTAAKRYLVTLEGLPSARVNDVIVDEDGNRAIVSSVEPDRIHALFLDQQQVRPGARFTLRGADPLLSFGDALYGRAVNALGMPVDGQGALPSPNTPLSLSAPPTGMDTRAPVARQFITGISYIDVFFPLGVGQRELVIGPVRSGKKAFLRSVVANQRDRDTVCIYTLLGHSQDSVREQARRVFELGGTDRTTVVTAGSEEPSPLISIAPSVAFLLAEHFRDNGQDVLLILDDLGAHAKYVREQALLEERLPGRESYPGDMFFRHAYLMERAGQFNADMGGGSITLLPVLETNIESYSDLITTNLMAATDGHLFFSFSAASEGFFPAITAEESVTRIGRNTQTQPQRELAERLLSLLAEYRQQEEYARFGTQLSTESRAVLRRGRLVHELLKQTPGSFIAPSVQVLLLSLPFVSLCEEQDADFARQHKGRFIAAFTDNDAFADSRELALSDVSLEQVIRDLESCVDTLNAICQS